jgi:uncharacterized phage infection (PIP) family protein YhgE
VERVQLLAVAGAAEVRWERSGGMWKPTTNLMTLILRYAYFAPSNDSKSLTATFGQIGEGLQQLKRNDQQLDQQLEQISKGLTRLKGIAVDQSNEIKLQSVMIDQISDNMDKATGHLNDVNLKLKETLQKAGGATNIIVKIILLILLLGVAAYLYKMFA